MADIRRLENKLNKYRLRYKNTVLVISFLFVMILLISSVIIISLNHKCNEKSYLLEQKEEEILYLSRTPTVDISVLDRIQKCRYVLDNGISTDLVLYTDEQCQEWNLNPLLIWSIIELESNFNPSADNPKSSARGLGQIIKGTGKYLWESILGYPEGSYYHEMAYDPYVNIRLVCTHLGNSFKNGYSLQKVIKAYSGGTSGYYNKLVSIASSHGYELNDASCHYV